MLDLDPHAGAYITNTADASKNGLTTGTLTVSDIQNHSDYSASSGGFSAGAGIGSTGKAVGPGSVSGAGGVTPMMSQHDSGSSSATTKSAISAGTISVTDAANQAQDVAGINRDTTDLNGRVSKLPDVNNLLSAQADTMNAAQAAGQVVAQGIGAYADMKRDQASDEATAASWDEGGTDRVVAHTIGGALVAGLGGGSAPGGALGAGGSAALAGKLNGLADEIGRHTGSMTLGNVASNVLAGAGGTLLGGNSGAFAASNEDLYNRSSGNSEGKGWTGNEFIDRFAAWSDDPLGTLNRQMSSLGDQFGALMRHGAQTKISESPASLMAQGAANGVSAVTGVGGGRPPAASPGMVVVNSSTGQVANAAVGTPGNATLNSGNDDQQSANNGASDNSPYSNLSDSPSVGPGKNFTAAQKQKIYQQNMESNGGVLRSDQDGTELVMPSKSEKGVTPPSNEAQIDHIVPRNPADPDASKGTNSYGNAQVLSRDQNRQKSNK